MRPDPFPDDRQIVALVSLWIGAQQFQVDPECPVEDDSQLTCQFRSLTFSETRRQVAEIQVFGGLNIIAVLRRCEETPDARPRRAATQRIVRDTGGRPFARSASSTVFQGLP